MRHKDGPQDSKNPAMPRRLFMQAAASREDDGQRVRAWRAEGQSLSL